jgi:hypothetical protein
MKITADDEKLIVGHWDGNLVLISSRDGEVIKSFGKAHDHYITVIMITMNQKFFFTASAYGVLKQWNYMDYTLLRDHGKIMGTIISLCL